MSFEFNPADEDEHGQCRHEIERLTHEADYYRSAATQGHKGEWPKPKFVPARIRLPRRISGDWPIGHETFLGPGDFNCECNQYGAVSVTAENGEMLGVRLHEFEALTWKPNDKL